MRPKIFRIAIILLILLPSCKTTSQSTPTSPPTNTVLDEIPIYPESEPLMIGLPGADPHQEGHDVYSYVVFKKRETIEKFYLEQMEAAGWEHFGTSEVIIKNRISSILLFSKSQTIVEITLLPWSTTSYLVVIDISTDPVYQP